MRKYFLLAGVAGCLFSANATAGDLSPNGQEAYIEVNANVEVVASLTDVQDMDFGTLQVVSGTSGDLVSMNASGVISPLALGLVHYTGETQGGQVQDTTGGTLDGALSVMCADSTADPTQGGVCNLGDGMALKNVTYTSSSGTHFFGGTLTATSAITENKLVHTNGLRVSIGY